MFLKLGIRILYKWMSKYNFGIRKILFYSTHQNIKNNTPPPFF